MPHLGGSFHSFPWNMEFDYMSWISKPWRSKKPNGFWDLRFEKKTHNKFGTLFNADKFRIRCMSHFYDWEKQREENWTHKFLNCTKSIAFRLHSGFLLLSNDSMGFDATNVRLTEQNSEDTWNCWIHISSPHFFFFLKYHAMKYYTLQLSTAAAAMFCFINQNNNGKINT